MRFLNACFAITGTFLGEPVMEVISRMFHYEYEQLVDARSESSRCVHLRMNFLRVSTC